MDDGRQGGASDKCLPQRVLEALDRLSAAQLEAGGFDAAKVARIRAALRAGTLEVDPEAVANALARLGQGTPRKP